MSERADVPLGATAEPAVRYRATGMDCAHDAAEIEQAARAVAGVETVKVSVATQIMTAHVTDAEVLPAVERAVAAIGYQLDRLGGAVPDRRRRTVRRLGEQAGVELARVRGNWSAFTMVFRKPEG